MKESFVLYTKYLENIELLSLDQRGLLITALMRYVSGKKIPEMDGMTNMAYSFIKSQIDRDFEKYEETCRKRSEAGKNGGRPKANGISEKQTKSKKANGFSEKQNNPDNECDNECDNDLKENTPKSAKEKDNTYSCAFEVLWATYPRKKEKANAYKCYKARLADGFSEDELMTAVKRYADECKARGTEARYIKLGATFLGLSTPFQDYLGDYKPEDSGGGKHKSFDNFERRSYDMEALERGLIGS